MHGFTALPPVGAWRLSGAYQGFEVVRFRPSAAAVVFEGTSLGVEAGAPWTVRYTIHVSTAWYVRRATVTDLAGNELQLQVGDGGAWTVNGRARPDLDGCLDLDLEASSVTNTLPVHRLALDVGGQGDSAAAYVRTDGLAVERLDQTYRRLADDQDGRLRFDYRADRFGYRDTLLFDADGLAGEYPGIGTRVR